MLQECLDMVNGDSEELIAFLNESIAEKEERLLELQQELMELRLDILAHNGLLDAATYVADS